MSTEIRADQPATDDPKDESFRLSLLEGFKRQLPDADPAETQEWVDALEDVVKNQGPERADWLMRRLLKRARQLHIGLPGLIRTRYINTISPEQEPEFPGDEEMELRIRRIIRWNAALMVIRANSKFNGLGGHLSTDQPEDFGFKLQNALFRAEDCAFPFFQRGGGESFSVGQRLASFVVIGNAGGIRLGYFNEVTKDIVVTNAQGTNASASSLVGLERCDRLLRVATQRTQLVELG